MFAYTATIGRNYSVYSATSDLLIDRKTLDDSEWRMFQDDVSHEMRKCFDARTVELVERHYGVGSWEGVEEESCKVTFVLKHEIPADDLNEMRYRLTELARHYGQSAIALHHGVSELV